MNPKTLVIPYLNFDWLINCIPAYLTALSQTAVFT